MVATLESNPALSVQTTVIESTDLVLVGFLSLQPYLKGRRKYFTTYSTNIANAYLLTLHNVFSIFCKRKKYTKTLQSDIFLNRQTFNEPGQVVKRNFNCTILIGITPKTVIGNQRRHS